MSDHAEHPHPPMPAANAGDVHAPNAGHTAAHDKIEHGHEAHTSAPQAEELPIGKVVMVGVVSILIFAVGSIWALKIRSATIESMNPTGAAHIPASMGAEEQGMVDQIPFDLNHWVKDDRAAARERLHSYGWVDRKAGTIHIPIERAIELQLADAKAPKPAAVPESQKPADPENSQSTEKKNQGTTKP